MNLSIRLSFAALDYTSYPIHLFSYHECYQYINSGVYCVVLCCVVWFFFVLLSCVSFSSQFFHVDFLFLYSFIYVQSKLHLCHINYNINCCPKADDLDYLTYNAHTMPWFTVSKYTSLSIFAYLSISISASTIYGRIFISFTI